jgi:cyclic beta-1,2-glucan synthetase
MYRAGIEGILGIRREGAFITLNPCIPSTWSQFEATIKEGPTDYHIRIENPGNCGGGVPEAFLDQLPVASVGGSVRIPLDGVTHSLLIRLGASSSQASRCTVPVES